MLKDEAQWRGVDNKWNHPFHTIVKVRKYYYDINGRLGTKREIVARWPNFRNKKVIEVSEQDVKKYIKYPEMVKELEEIFDRNYKGMLE